MQTNSAPVVTGVSPSSFTAGAASSTLTVTGTGFTTGSIVQMDATALGTTYVSATSLTAQVPASLLANARNAAITVQDSSLVSTATSLAVNSPAAVLTAVSPTGIVQKAVDTVLTLTGTGFIANSSVTWNGTALTTVYVSPTTLRATIPAALVVAAGQGQVAVNNPTPNASTSGTLNVSVVAVPTITSVTPGFIQETSSGNLPAATFTITGTKFASNARVTLAGVVLNIVSQTSTQIVATTNTSLQLFVAAGAQPVVVFNPVTTGSPSLSTASQPATVNVINPSANFSVSPNSAALGSPDTTITLSGQGFFADSVVMWNGTALQTTFKNASSITAVVPAGYLAVPTTATISISTPENMGQPSQTAGFNTYLTMPINALVYNAKDGLLYATVAGTGGPKIGNSLIGIDPVTGVTKRTIFVGSEPTELVLSTDGTQAFVGLNGAGAVRQVNLTTGVAGVQFSLGGTQGVYNPPYTASALAALPGQPNSVAVYGSNGVVTIFDAGVARAKTSSGLQTYFNSNVGAMAFGASAATLYLDSYSAGNYVYQLTVDSTGITASKQLTSSASGTTLQYDNGRLYTPNGIVSDATTGATLGQFSTTSSGSSTASAATGPIVSDSTQNRAWIAVNNFFNSSGTQVTAYDEQTFLPIGSVQVTGLGAVPSSVGSSSSPADLVRWGQDGLAFHTNSQLFLLHGNLVKDTTSTPADLQVSVQVPTTVTTGTPFTFTVQAKNLGTSAANGAVLAMTMPGTMIFGSASPSQGSCNGAGVVYCNLGDVASGTTATLTVTATPTTAGAAQVSATVDSQTFDPVQSNNIAMGTTTATGAYFAPVPTVISLSPNAIATGTVAPTITVTGTGFSSGSVVLWNGMALNTSFVSPTQLKAIVDNALLSQIGSGSVSVSNAAPGGGVSGSLTATVYSLLPIAGNAMVYDPFLRKLMVVLPSTSTSPIGNSLVAVDPATGTTSKPILLGSEPNTIVESPGGKYLYIGLKGANSLVRFNNASQAVDATIPLVSSGFFGGPIAANALAAIPGLENSVAVDNVGIFDFNGTSATARPNSSLGFNDAVFPDAGHAYTYDNGSSGAEIYRYTVDANGVHNIDGSTMLGMGGFSGSLQLDHGLLFGSGGGIVNPLTTPLTQVGVLPLGAGPYGTGLFGGGALPYQATKKDFVMGVNAAGTWQVFMERFDTEHFVMEDFLQMPTGNNIIQSVPATLWGQDGIAALITAGLGGSGPSQLMLMRGGFVLPAETASNTAPVLSAVGSGTLTAGSGNQWITVTGSGFIPGASLLWNGTVFTTSFVDAQHLTMAVGANDISKAGTITVTCQNPGSPASNGVTVTIQ